MALGPGTVSALSLGGCRRAASASWATYPGCREPGQRSGNWKVNKLESVLPHPFLDSGEVSAGLR